MPTHELFQLTNNIANNIFFYLFIIETIIFFLFIYISNKKKKKLQANHNIDINEYEKSLERMRIELLRREDERTRQWMESEKETLHVLNGVSNLLDVSEKLCKFDSDKILKKLQEIQDKVEKITTT